jgi:hypothetical protein
MVNPRTDQDERAKKEIPSLLGNKIPVFQVAAIAL